MHDDWRVWLDAVRQMGELRDVVGADPHLEVGAITEMVCARSPLREALLFDELKGYPKGQRILVNYLNSRDRLALLTNLPRGLSERDFVLALRDPNKRMAPVPREEVASGPVFEHVQEGSAIDLLQFPAPFWHEDDGGRYLGTGAITITRDPEDGWVNVGTYRAMVYDENSIGLYISPGHHGRIHREKWHALGKPCPVAISFGHDPLLSLVATMSLPYGQCEYDYAGGMRGAPIRVVKGPYTGLPIPADAELVLEGECYPGETRPEGPFGEWTGYYASDVREEPFVRLRSILHRSDPITLGLPPYRPSSGAYYHSSLFRAASIWDALEAAGVPDVRAVWNEEAAGRLIAIVSIKQRYPGHSRQAGLIAAQCGPSAYMTRYVIVVDEDIDIFNREEVLWALATRSDPATSVEILRRTWSGPLDPILPPGQHHNSRMVIDACRPFERLATFPKVLATSPELQRRVAERWGHLLRSPESAQPVADPRRA